MALLTDLLNLDLSGSTEKIIAEYIWIGGSGMDLRSKARPSLAWSPTPASCPSGTDGSSTGQALARTARSSCTHRPSSSRTRLGRETTSFWRANLTNKRYNAAKIFSNPDVAKEEPWYGIEQEYTLLQKDINWPLGWPVGGFPGPQLTHHKACLFAGVNISGINGEVMPGQRITEIAGVVVTFDPKPIPGDWNGAGAHTNYRSSWTRSRSLLKHKEHIAAYGEGNERRLTGKHETADINTFSWGVANRGASVRVGRETEQNGRATEDRRLASNMDPTWSPP
ncbi:hypothetical protein ZWY2020_005800 [Hordeum vulgare]|nr:hypothetical protein ZWY2020_005800 [Hordeum vulgare]